MLDCHAGSNFSHVCMSPPNSSIAPPGQYMLFSLSEGVPSFAPYVSLQAGSAQGA